MRCPSPATVRILRRKSLERAVDRYLCREAPVDHAAILKALFRGGQSAELATQGLARAVRTSFVVDSESE